MIRIKSFESGMCATNSYILADEHDNCVLIDPEGKASQYTDFIKEHGLTLVYIMLTHGHFDHIGALDGVKAVYDVPVLAGADEKKVLNDPNINLTYMVGKPKSLDADRYLADDEEVKVGEMTFKTVYTPGHTCGSVVYLCHDIMIAGDTLFMGSCGRTDFATGDWNKMNESLRLLKNLEGDYRVLPGHGPETLLSTERKTNMFMRDL